MHPAFAKTGLLPGMLALQQMAWHRGAVAMQPFQLAGILVRKPPVVRLAHALLHRPPHPTPAVAQPPAAGS